MSHMKGRLLSPRATCSTQASSTERIHVGLLLPKRLGFTSSQKPGRVRFLYVLAGLGDQDPLHASLSSANALESTEPVGGVKTYHFLHTNLKRYVSESNTLAL